jgi:hypothetical protein
MTDADTAGSFTASARPRFLDATREAIRRRHLECLLS